MQQYRRITPASAGNTFLRTDRSCLISDHPRICGEHCDNQDYLCHTVGSPPHLRGTLDYFGVEDVVDRITPASAGNTCQPSTDLDRIEDHPRICGEHTPTDIHILAVIGSPPHLRGTRVKAMVLDDVTRITPASAGNTHRPISLDIDC